MSPLKRFAVCLLVVLLGGAYFAYRDSFETVPFPYPELRAADADLVASIERELDRKHGDPLRRAGPDGAIALVAALYEHFPRGPSHTFSYRDCWQDAEMERIGVWLAERRDPSLNALLLRMAADQELAFRLRIYAVIGLCWPGNRGAIEGLARLTFDTGTDGTIRDQILYRMERIGGPLSDHLGDHLYLPFERRDRIVAAVLAVVGEPLAPSLVLECLEWPYDPPDGAEYLSFRAARRIASGDAEVRAACDLALTKIEDQRFGCRPEIIGKVEEAFRSWLETHPDALRTPFEERRKGTRDRLTLASRMLAIVDRSERSQVQDLDRLERLAILLEKDLVGVATPREKLAALHRRLLPDHMRLTGVTLEEGPSSFLPDVLRSQAGNCVGLTSLYLAFGKRLDLPLRAMQIPGHVYLRYDDGEAVIDAELTDHGRTRTAAELDGVVPRVLSEDEFLSVILSNRALVWLRSPHVKEDDRLDRALEFARRSLELDPLNTTAWLARARGLVRMDPANPTPALEAAEKAFELDGTDYRPLVLIGEVHLTAGQCEEALGWFRKAGKLAPDEVDPIIGILAALQGLTRHGEVVTKATSWMERHGERRSLRLLRFRSLVVLRDSRWREELRELGKQPPNSWELVIGTAELLMMDPAEPTTVIELIDSLEVLRRKAEAKSFGNVEILTHVVERGVILQKKTVRDWWERAKTVRRDAVEELSSRR